NQQQKSETNHTLPSLTDLSLSFYNDAKILNLTLRLIHSPNLEKLRLANLNLSVINGPGDFSSTFRSLGDGILSGIENLQVLEMRRVSCISPMAWKHFCAKLIRLRTLHLAYMSDSPGVPHSSVLNRDPYAGYLYPLTLCADGKNIDASREEPQPGDLAPKFCPNLVSLHIAGCTEQLIMETLPSIFLENYLQSRSVWCWPDPDMDSEA
ncbi:hypothetical protein FRB90_008504, partial [Tulasnella sp. 427]